MSLTKFFLPIGCLLLSLSLLIAAPQQADRNAGDPGESMTVAAQAFLNSLTAEQLKTAVYDFTSDQRTGWHFIPKDSRKGMQVKHMDDQQRQAARKLLAACLSEAGFQKATTIMELEGLLRAIEQGRGAIRDPERYYYTVFGKPENDGKWGLSIEGHHLSLNFVVENNELIAVSPSFFAANPATVQTDIHAKIKKGTRVLAREEELGFQLVNSLGAEQLKVAKFADKAPAEIRAAGEPQPPQEKPIGIPASQLQPEQLTILKDLVMAYSGNFPPAIEKQKLAEIEKAGWDQVKFAWGGATEPGIGHYYRIEGSTFLIEFVNTQPDAEGNPANHIHCVWRNPQGDFAIEIAK